MSQRTTPTPTLPTLASTPHSTPGPLQTSRTGGTHAAPLAAAKTPIGPGGLSVVGLILALVVLALGVVGVQAALVATGLLSGKPWLTSGIALVNGLRPAGWMPAAGTVMALLGLWLLLLALKPRPRTAVALQAATGVFLRPRDLARLAVATADDVDGVQDAHASASRTTVTLTLTTTGSDTNTPTSSRDGVTEAVKAAVTQRLSVLDKPVRVRVRTRGGSR